MVFLFSYPIGKSQDTVRLSNMSMQNLTGGGGSATLGPSTAFYSGRTRAASFSSLGGKSKECLSWDGCKGVVLEEEVWE